MTRTTEQAGRAQTWGEDIVDGLLGGTGAGGLMIAYVLLAGDAVSNLGRLRLPPALLTMDTPAAKASVHKMAALDFETLGIGHGAPVTRAASAAVKKLAATL